MPQTFTELRDEFAPVHQAATEAGLTGTALPRARRGWVNVPTGGHVSEVCDWPPVALAATLVQLLSQETPAADRRQ